MKAASLSPDNKQQSITLQGIFPDLGQVSSYDKLRLIRVLAEAEELEISEKIFPFEQGKTYSLPTPYDTFGAGGMLMRTLKGLKTDEHAGEALHQADESMNRVSLRSDLEIKLKFNDPVIPAWKPGSSAMDGTSITRKYLLLDSRLRGNDAFFKLVAR
uniref:Uncharacterized protein n=1 Tax=Candidatus Kentrum sp. LPFa TaxID=2126335 RepID=A0A450WF14_9GAMM|nr:MAG: hypothetical protein BECKLPF1236B_GA0070989_108112 [Candidatus Kentron sp. LPFa]